MVSKLVIALSFVTMVTAGLIPAQQLYQAAPKTIAVAQPVYARAEESYDAHPKYQFAYSVKDEHTGDIKHQVESRDGDLVQGEYSLIDSDGYKRVVQYTADHEHGFNAVVHREPLEYAVKGAPVAYDQPAVVKSTPVALVKQASLSYGRPAIKSESAAYTPSYSYSH